MPRKKPASKPARRTTKTRGQAGKVFRDPIHDLIQLTDEDAFIQSLIDTKEFQRLRRIRQLGLTHFVYPGAEHTRFAHSLGVFNFARRMIEKLRSRHTGPIGNELKRSARVIKAAALLHDIGHGPFSHVYERVFEDEMNPSLRHEDWTCRILRDKSTEVHKVLEKAGLDVDRIVALVSDAPSGKTTSVGQPYLKDIVSSQLDADRMDYLLRDSLMTGSRYGHFDSEWILNTLAIGEVSGGPPKLRKLCLDAGKGIGAIEGLLVARLLMTKHVYGHKTARAYESEMINTLRLALQLHDELPGETPAPVLDALRNRGEVDIETYLMLDDEVVSWALRRWAVWRRPGRKKLVEALSRHALRLVRRAPPWKTVWLTEEQSIEVNDFRKGLEQKKDSRIYECQLDELATWPYKDPAVSFARGADEEQEHFQRIYLARSGGRATPLGENDSTLLAALKSRSNEVRFHYDREHEAFFSGQLEKFGVR